MTGPRDTNAEDLDLDSKVVTGDALFGAMFEASGVIAGVFELLENDYRYVVANRNTAAFYGRPAGGLDGMTGRQLGLSDVQIEARLKTLRSCLDAGKPVTDEYPFRLKGVGEGWFLGTFAPIPGRSRHVSFIVIDITDRHRAQRSAEWQSERLSLALEAAELGIWEYDVRTDTVTWDERTRFLFGAGPDEPIDFAGYLRSVHADDRAAVQQAYETAMGGAGEGRYVVEHRTQGRDGKMRWIRGAARIIVNKSGEPVRIMGTAQDITGPVTARERQALMLAELNHRVKNNLATVQAIASHTLRASRNDLKLFREAFQGRLLSLARGHDLLTRTSWETPDLAELLEVALEPFRTGAIRVGGAPASVRLHPELAINMVMVLHELATNAAKYGALSREGGAVSIDWALEADGVVLHWREQGGPPVSRPSRLGFGTRLKDAALRSFGGEVRSEFAPDGLQCRLTLPLGEAVTVTGPPRSTAID